jgi:UDP-GlcNAc:undecaprenyl-phosphate GlcNAc-1-phosphate transferase
MNSNFFFLLIGIIFFNLFAIFNFTKIAKIYNIYDYPNIRKLQNSPISLAGGLLIFLNLIIITFFEKFNFINSKVFFDNSIILSASIFFIIGFFDDKYDLNPLFKILFSFFILVIFLEFNSNYLIDTIRLSFMDQIYKIDNKIYSLLFTSLCFLLYQNALNMYDGINLQSGLYFFSSIAILSFISHNFYILIFCIPIFFFLYLNFKNYCYIGSSGIFFISFLIGCLFIDQYNSNLNKIYADYIFIFMLLPGIDMFRLFILRIKKGKNPFNADKQHIHHILLKKTSYYKTIALVFFTYLLPIIFLFLTSNSIISVILFFTFYFFLLRKS